MLIFSALSPLIGSSPLLCIFPFSPFALVSALSESSLVVLFETFNEEVLEEPCIEELPEKVFMAGP